MTPWIILLALALSLPVGGEAQAVLSSDSGQLVRTRSDLERTLEEYERALSSPAYSESVKRTMRVDAERIRSRLRDGDFRVGDRVQVSIQGESGYPATVVVGPGPAITLPTFGEVSLAGVLRSEITDHLTEALTRFIRDPVVQANGEIRLAVLGAVGQPGFYTMPAETILGDALMLAGGPSGNANMEQLRVDRGEQRLYEGATVQRALQEGLTLDQLNLQAGDQIMVPTRSTSSLFRNALAVVGAIGTLTFLIVRLTN